MTPSAIGILHVALGRLRVHGWCQGAHARDAKGKPARFDGVGAHGKPENYSAYGALGGHDVVDMLRAREALWRHLGARQIGFGSLIEWNDAPERTQAEVVTLYQDTIAGLAA